MRRERVNSIRDDAAIIQSVIEAEQRSGIPEGSVEDFNFLGSQLRDLNGWFVLDGKDSKYFYLNRDDGYEVTVQTCHSGVKDDTYYFVYVEKSRTDEIWNSKEELVPENQGICHTFRWVRSLKHALYIGQYASENFRGFAYPEHFFLTRKEYDDMWKLAE